MGRATREEERTMPHDKSFFNQSAAAQLVTDKIKGLFASMETSRKTDGDWLQLERSTFKDLVDRGKVRKSIDFKSLKNNPELYDEVALSYLMDLQQTFKIPSVEEAALWSYRPGWYKKYKGDIENIPDDAIGSHGKNGKEVMRSRLVNLNQYMESMMAEQEAPLPQSPSPEIPQPEMPQPQGAGSLLGSGDPNAPI